MNNHVVPLVSFRPPLLRQKPWIPVYEEAMFAWAYELAPSELYYVPNTWGKGSLVSSFDNASLVQRAS